MTQEELNIPSEKIALRDDVLNEVAHYCSNLSQQLFIEYSTSIIPAVLSMEWNNDLYLEFLQYKRLIDTKGRENACNSIILNLQQLIKESAESRQ